MAANADVSVFGNPLAAKIEDRARKAYLFAFMDPDNPLGPGDVALALFGPRSLRLVDTLPAGIAHVELATLPGDDEASPVSVSLRRAQSAESMTLACARACSKFVAWVIDKDWTDEMVDAVALAIVMPRPIVVALLEEGATAADLAYEFVLDPVHVAARLRIIRGAHGSGDRFHAVKP